MASNQVESSRLEQKSVIKFLMAEKYKPCEIYRRMCNVCSEACFSPKNIHKKSKHRFAIMSLSQKETHKLCSTEKFSRCCGQ